MWHIVSTFLDTISCQADPKYLDLILSTKSQLPIFYLFATATLFHLLPNYLFGFLEGPSLSPLGRLEVICLGRETSLTLAVDRVATGTCWTRIGVGLDSDFEMDPNPSSKPIGVDSAKFSSMSSNSMGGTTGFAFRQFGGLGKGVGGVGRYEGYWGRRVGSLVVAEVLVEVVELIVVVRRVE